MPVQGGLSVERMCQMALVSRAGYYRSYKEHCPVEEEMLVRSAIQQIVVEHRRRYGYRRVRLELEKRGMVVNHKRVLRLMGEDNLLAVQRKQFVVTTDSNHRLEIAVNLARRMKLTGVNQLWVADITYIQVWSEFVFLAVVLDAFSRKVVGWELSRSLEQRLGAESTGEGDHGTAAAAGTGPSLGSRFAVRVPGVCGAAGKAPDGGEHEPAGKSLRQRALRAVHADAETGRNLCQRLSRHGASAGQPERVHRALLQQETATLSAGLSLAGRV
jgi:hypothetical protein